MNPRRDLMPRVGSVVCSMLLFVPTLALGSSSAWDDPRTLFDATIWKALRAAGGVTELLVSTDQGAFWQVEGTFEVVSRTDLPVPPGAEETFDTMGVVRNRFVVGSMLDSEGEFLHVGGVATELPGLDDGAGLPLRLFVPAVADQSLDHVVSFAEYFVDAFDGFVENVTDETLVPLCGCEDDCLDQQTFETGLCSAVLVACTGAALASLVACAGACGGVPQCEAVCVAAYLAQLTVCFIQNAQCVGAAKTNYRLCLTKCDFP